MKGKALARAAWKVAKPIVKKQGKRYMDSHGGQAKVKVKGYIGKKTDSLIDKGANKIGIKDQGMRNSAKKLARKGVDRGVDMGAAYMSKKLSS